MTIKNLESFTREIEILESLFKNSFEQAGGKEHRFFHSVRVAQNCKKLADKENISNKKLFIISALFHDIGKAKRVESGGFLDGRQEVDKIKGSHEGYDLVLELLNEHIGKFYSEQELKEAASYISDISLKESKLIKDADNLDEVGLVNIWKMFTYSGLNKVSIKETVDYYLKEDRGRLLKKIEEKMYFDSSKKIAKRRMEKVDEFLNDLKIESFAEDF